MVSDLELLRENDDIELEPEKVFENNEWDPEKFNAMFEKSHQENSLVHVGNPDAWGPDDGAYTSCEGNYNIYDESNNVDGENYAPIDEGDNYNPVNKEDMKNLKGNNNYNDHNKTDESYNKSLEDLMKQYEQERDNDLTMDIKDYSNDESMGGYGITKEFGETATSQITWDNEESMKEKYKKLLETREFDNEPEDHK